MASEWAWRIAREQLRDIDAMTMAYNLDAARAQGRREGLEEAAGIARAVAEMDDPRCLCGKCLTSGLIESDIRASIAKELKA